MTHSALALVHHSGKDAAKGARGHSSLRAATDTEIEVARVEGEVVSTVHVTKQRDMEDGQRYSFELVQVTLGTNRRRKAVTSCIVRYLDHVVTPKVKLPGSENVAIEALKNTLAHKDTAMWNQFSPDLPTTVPYCTIDAWRHTYRQTYGEQGDKDLDDPVARRTIDTAFRRARNGLRDKGLVCMFDRFAWIVATEATNRRHSKMSPLWSCPSLSPVALDDER